MLSQKLMEAVQWAHRYCMDYNCTEKNEDVSRVFLKEMQDVFGPYLSMNQAERLLLDLNRLIEECERLAASYPESAPSKTLYEYRDYLTDIMVPDIFDYQVPHTGRVRAGTFKMYYWASMYCISRNSYAAAFGSDVTSELETFTGAEAMFLYRQIDSYILEREAREKIFAENNPELAGLFGGVDSSWYDLRDYLHAWANCEIYTVRAELGRLKETADCFRDRRGNWRPVNKFFEAPYRYTWIEEKNITEAVPSAVQYTHWGKPAELTAKEQQAVEDVCSDVKI